MKRIMFLVSLILSMLVFGGSAFAGGGATTCSLSASATEITAGQPVTWTAVSNPAGQKYFWHFSSPYGGTENRIPGEGTSLTPWKGTYTYSTPGTYMAYFTTVNETGAFDCTSNWVYLTVNPVFVAGTNIFPNYGTFVNGQYFQFRTYSNVAPGVRINWALVIIDDKLVGVYSGPMTTFNTVWGSEYFPGVGKHYLEVIMETTQGRVVNDADIEVISEDSATPHQISPTTCVPLPSVGPITSCVPVPLPPTPPPSTPTLTLPPGCTSNQGFSETTGGSCSV